MVVAVDEGGSGAVGVVIVVVDGGGNVGAATPASLRSQGFGGDTIVGGIRKV